MTSNSGAAELTDQPVYVQVEETGPAQPPLPHPTLQPIHIRMSLRPPNTIPLVIVPVTTLGCYFIR